MMVRIGSNSPMLDRKPMAETKIQENPAFLLSDWALGLARQLGALRTHILCALGAVARSRQPHAGGGHVPRI